MSSYVLTDATLLQENLKSFDKVSFEKVDSDKTLILGTPVDIDTSTPDDVPDNSGVCDAIDGQVDSTGGLTGYYSAGAAASLHVYIVARDFSTGQPIPGATISVGNSVHIAGPDGRAYVGLRAASTEYSLRLTATGYRDSDQDELANDSFVTPDPPAA